MYNIYMGAEKTLYDEEYEKTISSKNTISIYPEDWVECNESDLALGDIVYVEYSPDSQKHLYTHYPEYGSVQKIELEEYYSPFDEKTKTEPSITILNHEGRLVKLNKYHLSMYSRGYFISIKKYKLNHKEHANSSEESSLLTCEKDEDYEDNYN